MTTAIRLCLSISFLLSSSGGHSQTLTCQYNCPQIGEVFSIKTASPVLHTAGLNQLWDFTTVTVTSGAAQLSYVSPASIPSSSLFSQANVAKLYLWKHTFLLSDNSGIKMLSADTASVNAQSFELPLSFSYGSSHSETVISTYMEGTDTIKFITTKSLNGVGTGTLMLPTGTYKDVLRISGKIVESYTKNGWSYGDVLTNNINYYYSERISHPLLYSDKKLDSGPKDFAPYTEFISDIPTGIGNKNYDDQNGIQLFPNPSSDLVHVKTPSHDIGELTLCNSIGKVVLKQTYSAGSADLNLREFPDGLYNIHISQRKNVMYKKLLICR